jgi:hypothetical protein
MTTFSLTEVCHAVMREGITAYIEHTGSGVMTLYAGHQVDSIWTVAAGPGRAGVYHAEEPGGVYLPPPAAIVANTEAFSVGPGNMQTWVAQPERVWVCPESAIVAEIADEIIRQVREHAAQTPVVTPVKTWPDTPEERLAFIEWQYEVEAGDTLRGFRDWLAAKEENPQ